MNLTFEEDFIKLNDAKGSLTKEDLSVLRDKTLAIDADMLLKKVKASPHKSLQEGHAALDMTVQCGIVNIINKFRNEFKIELIIVLDGLMPKQFVEQDKIIEQSKHIWQNLMKNESTENFKKSILSNYGMRFYQQEIINAAQEAKCQFFISPYFSSSQIVYFYQKDCVHACCGSSKILLYDQDQVIVDFDLDKKTFSFIDKKEMITNIGIKIHQDKIVTNYLVDLFILSGSLFNKKISTFSSLSIEEIIKKMNEYEEKHENTMKTVGQLMIEAEEKDQHSKEFNISQLKIMQSFLIKTPPILTLDLELGNLRMNDHNNFIYSDFEEYMGMRFNDEIYYYMSRGLLDPQILDLIPNLQVFPTIMLAPSMALKDAWESQEFKNFYQTIFNNLHEDNEEEKNFLTEQQGQPLGQYYDAFGFKKRDMYHFKWNLTEQDIRHELDRQCLSNVSFSFVLKWLHHDLVINRNSKSSLLKNFSESQQVELQKMPQVKTENEILVMCYFNYLEQRGFLGPNQEFYYGQLYLTVEQDFDEPVMIFLEMLKIFFPAGLEIATIKSHEQYQSKCNRLISATHLSESDKTSILLISRIFSLFSFKCKAIDDGAQIELDNQSLDYDLSQFNTYVRTIKFMMKSMFQSTMYRLFRSRRGDISLFQSALRMQAFNKEATCLFGYVIKSVLMRNNLDKASALSELSKFLTYDEFKRGLKQGCELWKRIYFIHQITTQQEKRVSEKLKSQFNEAHKFLISKMKQLGEQDLVDMLERD